MAAYYNEIDPFAAAWLRELIKEKLITDGEVDDRSIELVQPGDLRGFTQCHFFAGIGGWSYALRLAGWPDDREVWTGSCPCQPFSSAGTQAGGHDARDLWPTWFRLIRKCRPVVVFGEQVAAAVGHGWLDRLCDDLEREDYAVGPACLPGPCVGAFDLRQRLWFVADSEGDRWRERVTDDSRRNKGIEAEGYWGGPFAACGRRVYPNSPVALITEADIVRALEHAAGEQVGLSRRTRQSRSADGGVAVTDRRGCEIADVSVRPAGQDEAATVQRGAGFWSAADWIPCADGKARPVEPGTFPLATGIPARVGRLRGYGNSIKPQVAQVFIESYLDCERGIA